MVTEESIRAQLKHINFKQFSWGRAEVNELPHILIEGEEIYECVNGIYEGGFALLLATDVRLLLVDKKPFNYLTVEDLRFDMINEIDYNHRLFGAYISVSTGSKNMKFRSYNQPRLRKLIGHVQHCMAESKKKQSDHQEDQNQHLEQINQQLQTYLVAQYQHQEKLQQHLTSSQQDSSLAIPSTGPKPSPELSDYLFAQSLLAQHRAQAQAEQPAQPVASSTISTPGIPVSTVGSDDIYAEGAREIYGKRQQRLADDAAAAAAVQPVAPQTQPTNLPSNDLPREINPLSVAYSKLPMVLRNRKFSRPSLHVSHGKTVSAPAPQPSIFGA